MSRDEEIHAEWAELGLVDFSAEGYKPRLERERALAVEGKGPGAWLEHFLAGGERNRRQQVT